VKTKLEDVATASVDASVRRTSMLLVRLLSNGVQHGSEFSGQMTVIKLLRGAASDLNNAATKIFEREEA